MHVAFYIQIRCCCKPAGAAPATLRFAFEKKTGWGRKIWCRWDRPALHKKGKKWAKAKHPYYSSLSMLCRRERERVSM
jgi:hypothetical protein